MKKFLMLFLAIGLIGACSEKNNDSAAETENEPAKIEVPQMDYTDQLFEFEMNNLPEKCGKDSQIVCAIDLVVKCSMNPHLADCNKEKVPAFLFVEDPENVIRPAHFNYKIVKIKPIDAESIEVFTESRCDGSLFGLCQGNIIFVVKMIDGEWVVKDLYAIERPGEPIEMNIPDPEAPDANIEKVLESEQD